MPIGGGGGGGVANLCVHVDCNLDAEIVAVCFPNGTIIE